jgi:glycosyltransferase involved in cell wall biosynthesis
MNITSIYKRRPPRPVIRRSEKLSSNLIINAPMPQSSTAVMRVAYFINQYPAVSHTFIRREIRALEALGVSVLRFAARQGAILVDDEDKVEAKQTRFVLSASVGELIRCCITAIFQPLMLISVIWQAFLMGRRSDSGILRHMIYVVEAAVLANWCRRDGIQHIHAHFGTNSAAIAMFSSKFSGLPYSFTAHGSEEFEKAPLLSLDKKLKLAAFAVCVSSFGRSQLMRWSPPDYWAKIAVVHCGLDATLLKSPVEPPSPNPRLVCVGRLDEHKAQIVLVAAARLLLDSGTGCEIVLVGDGPMRRSVEEAISRAGMQGAINITGWASGDRVKAEIRAARALVLPSFSENMPVVIMEALALGRPVISTYVGGIPELVQHGKSGWLIPAGDEVALARAIREALIAPVAQLAAMGEVGRSHVLEHHDILKEARTLKDLFERSVNEKSSDQEADLI